MVSNMTTTDLVWTNNTNASLVDVLGDSVPDCGSYDLIMNALVKFILVGFGTIGNSLSIVVMWSERNTSATAFLLIVLALVDTLLMWGWTFVITAPGRFSASFSFSGGLSACS